MGGPAAIAGPTPLPLPRPGREIRAVFSAESIRVYQAYAPRIADAALAAQRFVAPFKRGRMTWIKPSFSWMMYRSGWGRKPDQERVLAIDVRRSGFDEALAQAVVTPFEPALHGTKEVWEAAIAASPVRVQWDPEKTLRLEPLPWRSLQMGLAAAASDAYVDAWTVRILDVTDLAHRIEALVRAGDLVAAEALAPREVPYPVDPAVAARIGATPASEEEGSAVRRASPSA